MLARFAPITIVALVGLACSKKNTAAPVAADDVAPTAQATGTAEPPTPSAQTERVHMRLGVDELSGVFAGLEKASRHWRPDEPLNIEPQLQAMLVQLGFGPNFYNNLDLGGRLAVDLAYPHAAQGAAKADPNAVDFAASIPARNARQLIEGMPASYRPQPLSDGLWQLIDDDFHAVLREQPQSLEIALHRDQLDRATGLPAELGEGRRIRARAWNLPEDEFDPASLLGIDQSDPGGQAIAAVLRSLDAVHLEVELGDDRDLEVALGATAPFSKLGLGPIGAPLQSDSALAHQLPAGPAMLVNLSWGQPEQLLELIDKQVPVDQVPAPFADLVKDALGGIKTILGQLREEVIMALYLSSRGEATVLLAAKVADENTTREALRKLWSAGDRAFAAHLALVGSDKNERYQVSYKPDGLGFSRNKADHFYVTVPKSMEEDADNLAMFLSKGTKLELMSIVHGNTAVVAIGAGARKTMADVSRYLGKTRKSDLESAGGLGLARRATGGCQVCVAIDPIASLRVYLTSEVDADDSASAKTALRQLAKVKVPGQIAIGTFLKPDEGRLGLGVPQSLIFADPEMAKKLREILEALEEAEATPPTPPTG